MIQYPTSDGARVECDPALSYEDVTFELPTSRGGMFRILENLRLRVGAGEFCCVVGPSGCGKTTALVLAAGFAEPTHGKVVQASSSPAGTRRRPAMVFQSDTVFPWMTVEGNLTFAHRFDINKGGKDGGVEEILDVTGLAQFRHFTPRQLSGGMRKRLELGRGWISGADILLLDEPLGQLDYIVRQRQQQVLQTLWMRRPRTIVMVTHDLEEAVMLGDRVVVMAGPPGRVQHVERIPFGRPRRDELRYSPEFQRLRLSIAGQLRGGSDERV